MGSRDWGVGHVSGCDSLGIEMRKVRDGASKRQESRVERWRFVVGKAVWGKAERVVRKISGWLLGGCEKHARMAYLNAGRGAMGKTV